MSEWRTVTTEENLHYSRTSSHRRWLTWPGIIVIILLIAGLLTLRQQRASRQAALREDLKAHIFQEETELFLGNEARAAELMITNAPLGWKRAYRRLFSLGKAKSPPGPLEIDEVEFDGQCALVTLTLGDDPQLRAYCLSQQQWRRAPVSKAAWGEAERVTTLENGAQLRYWPRDQRFAEALTADLNRCLETLRQHNIGDPAKIVPFEILIEPHDLQGPLILIEDHYLILNSPWLASARPEQGLSGETAVRLALVEALLQQARPDKVSSLPGATQFVAGLRSVIAMELLLSPAHQAELLEFWRSHLEPEWTSPFFAELLDPAHPNPNFQMEWTARLAAHYLFTQKDMAALLRLVNKIPEATSWDQLFQAEFGRSTIALEQEMVQYAYGRAVDIGVSGLAPSSSLSLPSFKGTLSQLEIGPAGQGRLYLEVSGQDWPLPVELPPELWVQTARGDSLAPGCLTPGTQVEVKGNWLELQRRLEATQVFVQDEITPVELEPAPAETVAYLIQGEDVEPGEPVDNGADSITQPALKPNYLSDLRTLMALQPNGTFHSLLLLNPSAQVIQLPMTPENRLQLLLILNQPGCDRAWFVLYRPDQGVVGQWLAPPEPMQWLWRADKQDFIFFKANSRRLVYEIYSSTDSFLPELLRTADLPLLFVGWNTQNGQLVTHISHLQEAYLGLFDLASGAITSRPHDSPLKYYTPSPGGNWLAYLNWSREGPLQRLEVLNMSDQSEATLLVELLGDYALWPPVWSMNLNDPKIAILGGPVIPDQVHPFPKWLILADPNYPNGKLPLAEALEGEALAYPIFCADGSIAYRVAREGEYRFIHYNYGSTRETWLTTNWPFLPLACP